jgi:hypothetical protein
MRYRPSRRVERRGKREEEGLAHIVVPGPGSGGMPMARRMPENPRREDKITVISNGPQFRDTGSVGGCVAISPRHARRFAGGAWVHLARAGFGKCVLPRMKSGTPEAIFETMLMKSFGIMKLR